MIEKISIKDMPIEYRPYEKAKKIGIENLNDNELLAVILRNGTKDYNALDISNALLKDGGLLNIINFSNEELMKFDGIGEIKAIQLKALCEFSKRFERCKRKDLLNFNSAESIATYSRSMLKFLNYEELVIFYLSSKLKLLYEEKITTYEQNVKVPFKEIVKNAILNNASRIILVHNHPSNDLTPSNDDIKMTLKLKEVLNTLDIILDDHVIVSDDNFLSLKFNNMM